jgi:hypothetical protein
VILWLSLTWNKLRDADVGQPRAREMNPMLDLASHIAPLRLRFLHRQAHWRRVGNRKANHWQPANAWRIDVVNWRKSASAAAPSCRFLRKFCNCRSEHGQRLALSSCTSSVPGRRAVFIKRTKRMTKSRSRMMRRIGFMGLAVQSEIAPIVFPASLS